MSYLAVPRVSLAALLSLTSGCRFDTSGLLMAEPGADGGEGADVGDVAADSGVPGCACGPCQRCGAATGACEIDPASRWEVWCVSAGVAVTLPSGDSWDPPMPTTASAAPDPYCQFDLDAAQVMPTTTGITPTEMDTFTPGWNQLVIPGGMTISGGDLLSATATWLLTVGDADCALDGACVGQPICQLRPPMDAMWLSDGMVTLLERQSCRSLTLKFVCKS